jgi:hypothetical protein
MTCHFVIPNRNNRDYAFLSAHPDHGIEGYQFRTGAPLADRYAGPADYAMDADYPDRRTLYDVQPNSLGLLIASDGFARALPPDPNLELLPIRILDHRGKVVGASYWIVHPLGFVDCIDAAASDVDADPLDPQSLGSVRKLALDRPRVPAGSRLFRIRGLAGMYAVTADLRDRLRSASLRGVDFVEVGEYDSSLF